MRSRIPAVMSLLTILFFSADSNLLASEPTTPIDVGGALQIACQMTEGCGGGLVYHTPEDELAWLQFGQFEIPSRLQFRPRGELVPCFHGVILEGGMRALDEFIPAQGTRSTEAQPVVPAVWSEY